MPASAAAAGASLQPSLANPLSPTGPSSPTGPPSPINSPIPITPPSPAAGLREGLLARVRSASASQDAELAAESAALEAAGECAVPSEAELAALAPDPLAGPPDGEHEWLAGLPSPLLD